MGVTIQIRRGTAAEWTAANPVLASGELGLETDTGKIKVGDGVANWNSTTYNVVSNLVSEISVGPDAAASGTGGIAFDGPTATLTYTPPDVSSLETVTSLSLSTNTLTYTDESGATTNLDLSLYLDDTNLARIVAGSVDPVTGIATFERDDSTTFTADFSALLDDTNWARIDAGTFTSGTGDLTLTRNDATTAATINLDGRYHQIGTDIPDADISESSVTQHQAALTITESQISDLGNFLSVGPEAAASGDGGISYNSGTGVLTYTPPDVPSLETTTELSLLGNELRYLDEAGATTIIDLSAYLDDTNLGRVTGATLGVNNVVTFTRDDATTFTLDLSTLAEQARVTSASFNDIDTGDLILTRDDGTTITANFDGRYVINETDPIFTAHTTNNIVDGTGFLKNTGGTWSYDNNTYLTTEVDPVFTAHTTNNIVNGTGFLKNDGAGSWSYDNNVYLTNLTGESIGTVADVSITSIADKQVLIYNSGTSQWENGQQALEDHSDVVLTSPTQGQALLYNEGASRWENGIEGSWTGYIDGGSSISIYNSGDFVVDGGNA